MSRKSRTLIGSVALLALGAILLGGTQYAMHKTSGTEFCTSCHSMSWATAEWHGSDHFSNATGVQTGCADCHLPPGGFEYVKAKVVTGLRDVWGEVTGKIPDQAAFEAHRLEMAQRVWADMKANDSAVCRTCHTEAMMITALQTRNAQRMHAMGVDTNQTCIDCHKGIVHFMPDMPNTGAESASELVRHGGEFGEQDKTLHTLAMTGLGDAASGEIRLLPFAPVTGWTANGDTINGTVRGWQQEGAEAVVYQDKGQRIMLALLDETARGKVKELQSVHDEVTDATWKEIEFPVSVPKDRLTANLAAMDAYGESLNQAQCSGCHAVIPAGHYTANQWVGVVNSMKDRTSLSSDETRTLTVYLQRNAQDMGGAH